MGRQRRMKRVGGPALDVLAQTRSTPPPPHSLSLGQVVLMNPMSPAKEEAAKWTRGSKGETLFQKVIVSNPKSDDSHYYFQKW